MRRQLCFMLAVLFATFSSLQLQAQIPYLPAKAILGTTLASGDFSAFAPQGDYTLEAAMTVGQVINVGTANRLGFAYTAKADGLHRFVVQGVAVYVFNNNVLVETITDRSDLFPNIFSGTTDNSSAKTGIYSELNLFKNPGFEENDLFAGYNSGNAPRGNPKYWDVPASYDVATLCRTHNITTDGSYTVLKTTAGAEGNWAYMVHQDVIPMWQKLDGIKAGTWYKATYRQMTHKDNSNASAMAVYLAKNPEGPIDAENALSVYNYYASRGQDNAMGNYKDITYYFQTPDEIPAGGLYFVIKRTGIKNHLAHYDRMTLVEVNPSTAGITATGISEIKYEAGAFPPQLTAGQYYYDMTSFVKNPNMDTDTDWINTSPAQNKGITNNKYNGDFTGCFYENWNGSNFGTGKIYQVVSGLPYGSYQMKAAAFADKAGAGVFIYGNDKKTAANTAIPTFQTVNFSVVNGTAEIGLVVEQANNQWIGLDDVRLYYLGKDNAYLADAIAALDPAIATATPLKAEKMGTVALNQLNAALALAEEAKATPTGETVDAALAALNSAIAVAQVSIAAYIPLKTAIDVASAFRSTDETRYSSASKDVFDGVIGAANAVYNNGESTAEELQAVIPGLQAAQLAYRLSIIATKDDPANFTFMIVNPTMDNTTGWVNTTDAQNKGLQNEDPNRQIAFNGTFMESWKPTAIGAGKVSQIITGVPNGKYLFKMAAFILDPKAGFFLMANEAETPIMSGDPTYHQVEVTVTDGTLELGVRINANVTTWFGIDNASLQYMGIDLTDFKVLLDAQITIAGEAKYDAETNYFNEAHYNNFMDALISAQTVYANATTTEELINETEALKAAIAAADISIAAKVRKTAILTASDANISMILANPKFDDGITGWTTNMGIHNGDTKWTGWDADYNPAPANNNVLDRSGSGLSYGYQSFVFMPAGYYVAKAVIRGIALTPSNLFFFINNGTDYLNTDGTIEGAIAADRIGNTGGSLTLGFNRFVTGVTIAEGDNVTLGIRADNEGTSRWQSADAFELHYYTNEMEFLKAEKEELLAVANALLNEKTAKTALNSAMNADWDNLSITDLKAALKTLEGAISSAKASIADYVVLNTFLSSIESALNTYSSKQGYTVYSNTVTAVRTDYNSGAINNVQAAILDLKMARNTCIYSDGPIHNNANLLYGWDAKKDGVSTPEAAGWIASQHPIIWAGQLDGPNEDKDALYRKNALDNYAFYAKSSKNNAILTYAYPVYLEAGKHYFFTGKNWRRSGQDPAIAANVTFAISSTVSKTGTILAEQTAYCDKEGYSDYSFGFDVASAGVYYLIRYAAEGSANTQDASTALSIVEVFEVVDGKVTITGELTPLIVKELATPDITSVDLTNATASPGIVLAFDNPNTVVYNVPSNVELTNGISDRNPAVLNDNFPFNAPEDLATTVSYTRSAFTANVSHETGAGWQTICLPFEVTSITTNSVNNVAGEYDLIHVKAFDAVAKAAEKRPFWVYKAENNNLVPLEADENMEANVPYLILIPNDAAIYAAYYNITGPVTFHGATIAATAENSESAGVYNLVSNFAPIANSADGVYGLNSVGDAFELGQNIQSFAAYAYVGAGITTAARIPIFGELTSMPEIPALKGDKSIEVYTTSNGVMIQSEKAAVISINTVGGQLISVRELAEGMNYIALPAGQYIINGEVVIVE